MEDLKWSEGLSVGNDVLDTHHRHLFDLLREIIQIETTASSPHSLVAVFKELNDYIAYHFAEEEAMMVASAFPFVDLHRHSHQTIAMHVQDLSASCNADNFKAVARDLHGFLSGWLVHHIEIEDFEYRPYISSVAG
ncbi:Hemerythrin-like protein [Candidatus Terasakiella magnetica]|nr:Hemerythrin-like protein [Candidatus Terasakiella magnetica]